MGHGWTLVDGILEPLWYEGDILPQQLTDIANPRHHLHRLTMKVMMTLMMMMLQHQDWSWTVRSRIVTWTEHSYSYI